jgi:cytoplasmic iron level regulating protein YaaA (DUF328/UPF0246 family)
MYISPFFRKMMAYAESLRPRRIYILSAKYGLLSPEDLIEPYELTLKTMKSADREAWAQGVLSALRQNFDLDTDRFVFLAGNPYRKGLTPHIKHHAAPMEGLTFGKQLQWLEEQVS